MPICISTYRWIECQCSFFHSLWHAMAFVYASKSPKNNTAKIKFSSKHWSTYYILQMNRAHKRTAGNRRKVEKNPSETKYKINETCGEEIDAKSVKSKLGKVNLMGWKNRWEAQKKGKIAQNRRLFIQTDSMGGTCSHKKDYFQYEEMLFIASQK